MNKWTLLIPALTLAACYPTDGWYYDEARAQCLAQGHQPGTDDLTYCIAALERVAYEAGPSPGH